MRFRVDSSEGSASLSKHVATLGPLLTAVSRREVHPTAMPVERLRSCRTVVRNGVRYVVHDRVVCHYVNAESAADLVRLATLTGHDLVLRKEYVTGPAGKYRDRWVVEIYDGYRE